MWSGWGGGGGVPQGPEPGVAPLQQILLVHQHLQFLLDPVGQAGVEAALPQLLSEITRSMIPRSRASQAVSFSRWAASSALPASFHKMLAQPSGEITEYTAFSSIHTRSATDRARAPPPPPQ